MNAKLTKYEQELRDDFEQDKLKPTRNNKKEIDIAKKAACNFIKKDKKITLRISNFDLNQIKLRAVEEGLPYQSLINSIVHKFVTGKLRSIDPTPKNC